MPGIAEPCAESIYATRLIGSLGCGAAPDPPKTLPSPCEVATQEERTRIQEKDERDIAPGTLQCSRCFECYFAKQRVSHNHAGRRASMRMQRIAVEYAQFFDGRHRGLVTGGNRGTPL